MPVCRMFVKAPENKKKGEEGKEEERLVTVVETLFYLLKSYGKF